MTSDDVLRAHAEARDAAELDALAAADDQHVDVGVDDRGRRPDLHGLDIQLLREPAGHRVRDVLRVTEHRFENHQCTHDHRPP